MTSLDQFYTKPEVAKTCFDKLATLVDLGGFDILMEPSAGKGAFINLFPANKRLGIDVDPKADGITQGDFLTFDADKNARYAIIGNPPFGRVSSMAVKFFNKAATFAWMIAFIVPRTFKKVSIHNRLNLSFRLAYTEDLQEKPCCFEPAMSAKCCFQVWVKSAGPARNMITRMLTHGDFAFVEPDKADFAMRAFGSGCGRIEDDKTVMPTLAVRSWYWISANASIVTADELKRRFRALDFSVCTDTARQDSLSKSELIDIYSAKYPQHENHRSRSARLRVLNS